MGRLKNYIFSLALILLASACYQNPKNADPFYTNKGEDYDEIPLIKPYKLIKYNRYDWAIYLNKKPYETLGGIKMANVISDQIFFYCKNTYITELQHPKEAWAVISPSKSLEKVFTNHVDYIKYIQELGFKTEPILHDVNTIADYYHSTDVMDWKKASKVFKP